MKSLETIYLEVYRKCLPLDSYTERYLQLCKARDEINGHVEPIVRCERIGISNLNEPVNYYDYKIWEDKMNPENQIAQIREDLKQQGVTFFTLSPAQYAR